MASRTAGAAARETLDRVLERHFAGVGTPELITRIERAADFKSDDEEWELTRRLNCESRDWRYAPGDRVEVYDIEPGAILEACDHAAREDRDVYVAGQVTETVTACEACADRSAAATAARAVAARDASLRKAIEENGGSYQVGDKVFEADPRTGEIFYTFAGATSAQPS